MKCSKCQGLCVRQGYWEHNLCVMMWRCINCGYVTDAELEKNRVSGNVDTLKGKHTKYKY